MILATSKNAADNKPICTIVPFQQHQITAICLSPTGKHLFLSGSTQIPGPKEWLHTIRAFEVESGKELRTFYPTTDDDTATYGMTCSPDGKYLAVSAFGRPMHVYAMADIVGTQQ